MKNIFLISVVILCSFSTAAQPKTTPEQPSVDWHLKGYTTDHVYGADVYHAYQFLQNRSPKRKTIVAVIDSNCDITHEDLAANLWTNRNEIPDNGIDDDKNGYVDDIHGWNFLGDATILSNVGDREFIRLLKKYENADTTKLSKKDYAEYSYFRNRLQYISPLCMAYRGIGVAQMLKNYAELFDREMKERFSNTVLTMDHYKQLRRENEPNQERESAHFYFAMAWSQSKNAPWEKIYELRHKFISKAEERYQKVLSEYVDQRMSCGDNPDQINNVPSGTKVLTVGTSGHSTHVCGIIGATRGNGVGVEGVADVELMVIRVVGDKGDEYDKDVALAIRYAVDNGANIINMSFGKQCSPHKKWVDQALAYADKKGVLMVQGAGNSSLDIDVQPFYPTKFISKKKTVRNIINVGSIAADGTPAITSNYGKEGVDLFAPGVEIYSTVNGNGYKKMSGTSMASPVVAGVAAMIWNYFPELSASQVRQVILESVTSMGDRQVNQPKSPKVVAAPTPCSFSELCKTGGLLNAYEAVKKAA